MKTQIELAIVRAVIKKLEKLDAKLAELEKEAQKNK